jgi:hypothetical protein
MVEPKAFQDALLAYWARPADREAEAVRAAALEALPRCKCGQPWVLNTVHRANSPCWLAQEPPGGLGPNPSGVKGGLS